MEVKTRSRPFGSEGRTRVLLALRLLLESYPRELARVLGMSFSTVQKALRSPREGRPRRWQGSRRTRVFRLDPRYFAHHELQDFLLRLTESESKLRSRVSALRRRPRRTAKPL